MKNKTIGYIYSDKKLTKDEKAFIKIAKKRKVNLIMINLLQGLEEKELEEKVKNCDIFYNNSAEDFALEIVKTIEELGKKVIDSSKTFYYTEDKWMFYLKCREHKLPVPQTILLSEDLNLIKKELIDFNYWPVIVKRVYGTTGNYVEKADNPKEAIKIINKFWKKSSERFPIIAQEFIPSSSYRVTTVGQKIVQTAIKKSNSWKATGVYAHNIGKFKVDKNLKPIIKKLIKFSGINVCGIDLLKKGDSWFVLEINAQPGLDFFENQREVIVEHVFKLLESKI